MVDLTPEIGITSTPVIDIDSGIIYVCAKSGNGIASDSSGNIYVETANGAFDAKRGGSDYSDSVVKLTTTGGVRTVAVTAKDPICNKEVDERLLGSKFSLQVRDTIFAQQNAENNLNLGQNHMRVLYRTLGCAVSDCTPICSGNQSR